MYRPSGHCACMGSRADYASRDPLGNALSHNAKCIALAGDIFVFMFMLRQAELATHSMKTKTPRFAGRILHLSRSRADSNRCSSFCRAEPSHSATGPSFSPEKFLRDTKVIKTHLGEATNFRGPEASVDHRKPGFGHLSGQFGFCKVGALSKCPCFHADLCGHGNVWLGADEPPIRVVNAQNAAVARRF